MSVITSAKIDYTPYSLKAIHALNCRSDHKERRGVLLRILFSDDLIGYSDCHPWVELGDLSWQRQLDLLKINQLTPLSAQSLRFARLDAEARSEKRPLLEGLKIPQSHFLINDLQDSELSSQIGFHSYVKIKLGREINTEITALQSLFEQYPSVHWRLDFNEILPLQSFEYFLKAMKNYLNRIDFIEDPFPFNPDLWAKIQNVYGITLASDHSSYRAIGLSSAAKVLILKPAIQHEQSFLERLCPNQKIVITTYLDHPIGQRFAAYIAAQLYCRIPKRIGVCGLNSHHVYEKNEFFNRDNFDELLENQNWQPL